MVVAQGLGDADRRAPRILRRNRDPKTTDAFTGVRLLAGNSWPAPGLATPASDIQLAQEVYRGLVVERSIVAPVAERPIVAHMGGGRAWAILAVRLCVAHMADIASATVITEAFGMAPDGTGIVTGGGHMA